ncbi:autoinducer binding domain-containing protein [Jannaschia sp. W003]|uniref:helix-turn-helix transcriptional regulator n=1 Tax=Jannaschia sp. W003 TaxID=2867012 RepID=UPI0021A26FFB|nr:autoinducer binding domain-containing protein [Jannaschia sp. W003]UWQ21664.1 autoinducer binding domain-containing protein [Jannaschia sp. W003]
MAEARDLADLDRALGWLRDSFDAEHIVYHCVRSCGRQWATLTYPHAWVETYLAEGLHTVDPVVQAGFGGVGPFDWKRLDWSARAARELMAEGMAHGLGGQGCSTPVRGPAGRFALFTVNGRGSDDTWARFTTERMGELILAAHYVQERALLLEGEGMETPHRHLSPREVDTLALLALGLSRGQAAERLAISEHTLRAYIESARAKLGASNTLQAVAKALTHGLISL